MSIKRLAAFDGNWLMNRAMSVLDGRVSNMESRLLSLVLEFSCFAAIRTQANAGVFCIDGTSNFRYAVYPGYKASRRNGSEGGEVQESKSVYEYLPALTNMLRDIGFPFLQIDNFEADDLLASAAHRFKMPVFLVSRDKDVRQCVSEKCTVYTPAVGTEKEVFWTPASVMRDTGMTPAQWLDYQILVGDHMDDVPAVLGKSSAKRLLKEHNSIAEYVKTEEGHDWFVKNQELLLRNRKLVRLSREAWPKDFTPQTFDKLSPDLPHGIRSKSYHALRHMTLVSGRSLF